VGGCPRVLVSRKKWSWSRRWRERGEVDEYVDSRDETTCVETEHVSVGRGRRLGRVVYSRGLRGFWGWGRVRIGSRADTVTETKPCSVLYSHGLGGSGVETEHVRVGRGRRLGRVPVLPRQVDGVGDECSMLVARGQPVC